MKKIISLILIAILALTLLTSCAGKVKIDPNAEISIVYDHEGTTVTSTLSGNNAALVINNLNGLEIEKDAPNGGNYVDGVYFKVEETCYYIDLNGSPVLKIGEDVGYVELEEYRFTAITSLFKQFGVDLGFDK